jgi:HK97 family phage major capsid protein
MAMQNELAPNTTAQHQGRLAYVPDNLFPKTITDAIWEKVEEDSLMLTKGEQIPVSFGETVIPVTTKNPEVGQVGVGKANSQREGYRKPISGMAWDTRSMQPVKFATIVTMSSEFAKQNPQNWAGNLRNKLGKAFGRAIDTAIIHGRDTRLGTPLLGVDADDVLNNTTNVVAAGTNPSTLYDELIAAYELAEAGENEFDSWIVDTRFRARLLRAGIERDVAGNLMNPSGINLNSRTGNILGFPASYGRAVRGGLGATPSTSSVGVSPTRSVTRSRTTPPWWMTTVRL